jgi:hypothetical protein
LWFQSDRTVHPGHTAEPARIPRFGPVRRSELITQINSPP